MPTHIIRFKLPDEQAELDTVLNAGKYASHIDDFELLMRNKMKHEEINLIERRVWEEIKKWWYMNKQELEL